MKKNEIINIKNINESQVPSIIGEQFSKLSILRKNVEETTRKAEKAQNSASLAKSKSARLFHKKEAIISLQESTSDLADAQISAAQAQEVSFEYQQKLGEITKYLFGLGVTNIAMNRSVIRELEMRLKDASEKELDEFARQEILGVVRQLKAQEDIMKKQGELTKRVKEQEGKLVQREKKDEEYDYKLKEHDKLFAEKTEKDKNQDEEIERQEAKDEELEKRIDEGEAKDRAQDEEIERQEAKDGELEKRIDEGEAKDRAQDEEMERQAAKDEELSKLVDELIQSNLEKETQIRELKIICGELLAKIESDSCRIGDVENGLIIKIDEKASKKENVISYIIGIIALLAAIIQFFI